MDDVTFLQQFEACAFPFDRWHHDAHIKIAYLYLRRHSLEEAISKMRNGIKAYNAANKVEEGPDRGYHETMTQAWVRLVHLALCEYGPAETADSFFEQHPELSQKKVLRLFYTRERFMSPQAKVGFLEPDLAPLPKSRKLQNIP
jgi:hypothetical protein